MKIKLTTSLLFFLFSFVGDTYAARFFVSPGTQAVPVGCEMIVHIMLDSESKEVNAADAILDYNPNEWVVIDQNPDVEGVQIREGDLFDFYAGNTVDTKTGKIYLTAFNLTPYKTRSTPDIFGSIVIKPLTVKNNLSIDFDYTPNNTKDSNIADMQSNDILNTAGNGVYKAFKEEGACVAETIPEYDLDHPEEEEKEEEDDSAPPYITTTIPENGAKQVPLNGVISFDLRDHVTGINPESLEANINNDVYAYADSAFQITGDKFKYSIVLTPRNNFPIDQEVIVRIKVKDLKGNIMPVYSFSFNKPSVCGDFKVEDEEQCEPPNSLTCSADCTFKDISPPYVHPVFPLPGAKNVPLDTNISFHLKDDLLGVDIDTLEVVIDEQIYHTDSEALGFSGEPLDYLIMISPKQIFKKKQKVSVKITAQDERGNTLRDFLYIFNDPGEDTLAPYVHGFFPVPGSNNVSLDTSVSFSVQDNLFGVDLESVRVRINDQVYNSANPAFSSEGDEMLYNITITPQEVFLSKQEVFVEITAQDVLGNVMKPYRFSFNRPEVDNVAPWVISPFPDPGSRNISVNTPLSFAIKDNYIGVDIDRLEVQINKKYYTKTSEGVQFSGDPLQYMITISPEKALPADTEIEVIINVEDISGNAMIPYKYYFNKPFVCGDGIVEAQEECEPPGIGTCDTQCRVLILEPKEDIKPEKEEEKESEEKEEEVGGQELLPLPDSDGDGISDLEEIMDYGTDPAVAEPLKIEAKITNWVHGDITASPTLIIKGVGTSGETMKAFARSKEKSRVQMLGDDMPDTTNKFVIASEVELVSGVYFLKAESYDAEGRVTDTSEEIQITIDTSKDSPAPSIKAIDIQQGSDVSAQGMDIYNSQPVITGVAPPFSKVTLIFESEITSITVTADENGFYSAMVPKTLEDGPHKVTVYSVSKEGVRSAATSISITISSQKRPQEELLYSSAEKVLDSSYFNWWRVIALCSLIFNVLLFLWILGRHRKKEKKDA